MSEPSQQNDKLIPSILVLIVTSFAILYQTGTLGGSGNNDATVSGGRRLYNRRDSSESIGSDDEGGSSSRSSFRVRSSSKTKCGLWHPSVSFPKTWYVTSFEFIYECRIVSLSNFTSLSCPLFLKQHEQSRVSSIVEFAVETRQGPHLLHESHRLLHGSFQRNRQLSHSRLLQRG